MTVGGNEAGHDPVAVRIERGRGMNAPARRARCDGGDGAAGINEHVAGKRFAVFVGHGKDVGVLYK